MSVGAIPIVFIEPPPEGNQSVSLSVTLTFLQPNFVAAYQLNNSSGGWPLSQVVSLFVDNLKGSIPVTIVHGALNETAVVQANSTAVISTLSNKSDYAINVAVMPGTLTSGAMTLNIVASNWVRPKSTFATVLAQTISGVGNTQSLASFIATGFPAIPVAPFSWIFTAPILNVPAGQYVLDSLDFAIEGVFPRIVGLSQPVAMSWEILEANVISPLPIAQGQLQFLPPSTASPQWIAGARIMRPVRMEWPNGYFMQRGATLTFNSVGLLAVDDANIQQAEFRFNVSGSVLP